NAIRGHVTYVAPILTTGPQNTSEPQREIFISIPSHQNLLLGSEAEVELKQLSHKAIVRQNETILR
ncbi:MAG: hypothetical protein MPJ24_10355, partial [Pirellulaceae bacterium]|nr:hypothetical protein [Pirellulaceae bacterium]